MVFEAQDKYFGSQPVKFHENDVDKMGFKRVLKIKYGCQVMATVNDSKGRYVNGDFGTVDDVGDPSSPNPRISVKFRHNARATAVTAQEFSVYQDGKKIFSRKQIPLALGACMTIHKTVGLTLPGIWCRFSGAAGSSDHQIAEFWGKPWLLGGMYTALSRTGDRRAVRVYPIRRMNPLNENVLPMYFMDSEALEFDRRCRQRNWLAFHHDESAGDTPSTENSQSNREASADPTIIRSDIGDSQTQHQLTMLRQQMDAMRKEFLTHSTRFFQCLQYETGSGINPVLYCWSKPRLREAVDSLPEEIQADFYKKVREEFNGAEPDDDRILGLAESLSNTTTTNYRRAEIDHLPHIVRREDPIITSPAMSAPTHQSQASSESPATMNLADDESSEEPENTDELEDTSSDDSSYLEPESPRHDPSSAEESKFEEHAFTVISGSLSDVVKQYLQDHTHFALEHGYSIKNLKSRKSCRLRCRRAVSKRYAN